MLMSLTSSRTNRCVALSLGLALATLAWFGAPPRRALARHGSGGPPRAIDRGGLVNLRPKWEKGETLRYVMRTTSESDQLGLEGEPDHTPPRKPDGANKTPSTPKTRMVQEFGLVIRVKEAALETGATLEIAIERVKALLDTDGELMEFDSDKQLKPAHGEPSANAPATPSTRDPLDGPHNPLAIVCAGLVGDTQTIVIDANGQVVSASGGSGLAALGQLTAGNPANTGGRSLFESIVSTRAPKPAAAVGEEWTTRDRLSTGPLGNLEMSTTYGFKSYQRSTATITFRGQIEPATLAKQPSGPASIASAAYAGTYLWDTKRGQLAELTSEHRVEMKIGAPGEAANTAQPRTVSSLQQVSVKRVEPER